jgi:hypothetical protein
MKYLWIVFDPGVGEVARGVDQGENVDLFWGDVVEETIASHQELADLGPPEFRDYTAAFRGNA